MMKKLLIVALALSLSLCVCSSKKKSNTIEKSKDDTPNVKLTSKRRGKKGTKKMNIR